MADTQKTGAQIAIDSAFEAALASVSNAAFDAGIKMRNPDQVTKDYTDALKFLRDLRTKLWQIAGPQPPPKT